MDRIEALLKAYQQGDAETRLYMYLTHSSLRERFLEIDYFEYSCKREPIHQRQPARGFKWMQGCLQKVRMAFWPSL